MLSFPPNKAMQQLTRLGNGLTEDGTIFSALHVLVPYSYRTHILSSLCLLMSQHLTACTLLNGGLNVFTSKSAIYHSVAPLSVRWHHTKRLIRLFIKKISDNIILIIFITFLVWLLVIYTYINPRTVVWQPVQSHSVVLTASGDKDNRGQGATAADRILGSSHLGDISHQSYSCNIINKADHVDL